MIDYTQKSSYKFDLPPELIAQTPIEPRDSSRLLTFDITKRTVQHNHFFDIIEFLHAGDVLVLNDTKVLPCRLLGVKAETQAKVEIFLTKRLNLTDWQVLSKPAKRLKVGNKVLFSQSFSCEILAANEGGEKHVRFSFSGSFEENLSNVGVMPLPPYIKEKLDDAKRYQTVYCSTPGSTAAPTAGLHFTEELLKKIEEKGVEIVRLLLHVGLGTFRPVKTENILEHKMHSEFYEVSSRAADRINLAKREHRRIIAVGTTSLRTLESAGKTGEVLAGANETKLFCYPPYDFKIVDALITNFHLSESTLLMLVCAFAGYENVMKLYAEAVKEKYRFFSFGDACFFYNSLKTPTKNDLKTTENSPKTARKQPKIEQKRLKIEQKQPKN